MIKSLLVDNFAIIDHLELELSNRLNIITGETGAGKSILMGALNLLLGAKNEQSTLKDPSRNCVIEAEFDLSGLELKGLFSDSDIDYDDQTVIRRVINPQGKSRSYINDQPVQLSLLREIGSHLIDIHSQHQNLILRSESFRIKAIDTIAGNSDLLTRYRSEYESLLESMKQLRQLREEADKSTENEQWLRYQVDELVKANLQPDETEELEQEMKTLENADSITETLMALSASLSQDETSVIPVLKERTAALRRIALNFVPASDFMNRLESTLAELKDIDASAQQEAEHIDSDPERLEKISSRLDMLYSLSQKHRVKDCNELIKLRDKWVAELALIENSNEEISKLSKQCEEQRKSVEKLAEELHKARTGASPKLETEVVAILKKVGMPESKFEVKIIEGELSWEGKDSVNFLFSANAKLSPGPIEKIASGGELSRVMLALKAMLSKRLSLPSIVFDEIDTGVSGRVANAMGEIICSLAEEMQVIDITHLPQVASKPARHFVVYKKESTTFVKQLSEEQRIEEIAKMISGESVTEAAIEQAKILLNA